MPGTLEILTLSDSDSFNSDSDPTRWVLPEVTDEEAWFGETVCYLLRITELLVCGFFLTLVPKLII